MSITNSTSQTRKKQVVVMLAISILLGFSLYHAADLFFHHLNLDRQRWLTSLIFSLYLLWAMLIQKHLYTHQRFPELHSLMLQIFGGICIAAVLATFLDTFVGLDLLGAIQFLHFDQQLSVWAFSIVPLLLVALPTVVLISKYPKQHKANFLTSFSLCFFCGQLYPLTLMWIYPITEHHGQPVSLTMTLVKGDQKSHTWAIQPSAGFTPQQPTLTLCYSCFDQPTPALVFGNTYTVAAKVGWFGDVAIDPHTLAKLATPQQPSINSHSGSYF